MIETWAFVTSLNGKSLYLDHQGNWFYSHKGFGHVRKQLDEDRISDVKLILGMMKSALLAYDSVVKEKKDD